MKTKKTVETSHRKWKPSWMILMYSAIFALVGFHEINGIISWTEDNDIESILPALYKIQEFQHWIGFNHLINAEEELINYFKQTPEIEIERDQNEDTSIIPGETQSQNQDESEDVIFLTGGNEGDKENAENYRKGIKLLPHKVLIIGDSMIKEGFGVALERELINQTGFTVYRDAYYSTGLTRPDYFNWYEKLPELISRYHPDVLIVMLGTNDAQAIVNDQGVRIHYGQSQWNSIYEDRVKDFLELCKQYNLLTFWIGLPIMSNSRYRSKVANLNSIIEEQCKDYSICHFVDTWNALTTRHNQYTTYMRDSTGRNIRIRARDGIHLTVPGGRVLVQFLFDYLSNYIQFSPESEYGATQSINIPPFYNSDGSLITPAVDCDIQKMTFYSTARNKETAYLAFVPVIEEEGGRFPVLYLLHGAWGSYLDWRSHAQEEIITLVKKYGLIIITPDGDEMGWYADSPYVENNQIETYFIRELLPNVQSSFPVHQGKLSIAGLSMGGHGALVLALRNPETFVSISSMSGILDITRHQHQWELYNLFGDYNAANKHLWMEHSAYYLAQHNQDYLQSTPLLITVSLDDQWALEDNRIFHEKLLELNIEHRYRESPGDHDWDYWTSQLPIHVAFHAYHLSGEN